MAVTLHEPDVRGLRAALVPLRDWQRDGASVPLHPGDLGWNWRFGATATAAAVRLWCRSGTVLAVGLIDSPGVLRLAVDPAASRDEELAGQLLADVSRPERGVLPAGPADLEERSGALVCELLRAAGWVAGEGWTPLRRPLAEPPPTAALRVQVTGPAQVRERTAVQRAAFERSVFSDERWRLMAAGPLYAHARCLVGHDEQGAAVAAATVWSAGPGRPGLLEPVGVHRDHRGRGYGREITLAAAAALRELGSSSAVVCTTSANVAAVATYRSAGFTQLPEVPDLHRSR